MQEFPSLVNMQSQLYRERRCFVPPEPKSVEDISFSGEMFQIGTKESVIKGDTLISEDKRVVMLTTNDLEN